MQCEVTQMALNMDEKIALQKWLHEHEVVCPTVINCNYTLGFSIATGGKSVQVEAKCGNCGKGKKL